MDQAFVAAVARAGDALIQNVYMLEALYNEPVSYTHLDVYKRQGLKGPQFRNLNLRGGR